MFIKLTRKDNSIDWVNYTLIQRIFITVEQYTCILFADDNYFYVKETPEQILNLIKENKDV